MYRVLSAVAVGCFGLVDGWAGAAEPGAAEGAAAKVDFVRDVAPLLARNCIDCHGPALQMAGMRLDRRGNVLGADADPDLVKPGKSAESQLIRRLTDAKLGLIMPPTFPFFPGEKPGLPEAEVAVFRRWIDQGAVWPEGVTIGAAAGEENREGAALVIAIRAGEQTIVVETLARRPALVHARDKYGETPLMHAALFSDAGLLRRLVRRGADVNAESREGATPLMRAAGDYEKTKLLLDAGARIDARSKLGRTALLVAAAFPGNVKTVELLLERGGDVNDKDQVGETCLTQAAKRGDAEMVKFLIAKGADMNAVSFFGRAAMAWAAEEGDLETLNLLIDAGGARHPQQLHTALFSAAGRQDSRLLRALLLPAANPNLPTPPGGYTPLLWASSSEYVNAENVKLLLEKGADVSLKGADGQTPLSLAKRRGRTAVMALLDSSSAGDERRVAQSAAAEALQPGRIRAAVEKALPLLQSSGPTFFTRSGCIACHQQSMASLAVAEARKRGIAVDEQVAREQLRITGIIEGTFRERFLQRADHPAGSAASVGYVSLGLAAEGYPADDGTDAMIVEMAGRQQPDGSWAAFAHRPPLEYSQIINGALAIRAMQLYGPPAMQGQLEERIRRAAKWLAEAKPTSRIEEAFLLLGLHWAGGHSGVLRRASEALVAAQNADGGWSAYSTMDSDAFVTGVALWALQLSGGAKPADAAYARGLGYLVRTQLADGSWHVKTRAFPFQPYFESGFPHGHDQWISASATGFAAVALMQALPGKKGGRE